MKFEKKSQLVHCFIDTLEPLSTNHTMVRNTRTSKKADKPAPPPAAVSVATEPVDVGAMTSPPKEKATNKTKKKATAVEDVGERSQR